MNAADRLAEAAKALESALVRTRFLAGETPHICHIIRCDDGTLAALRAALAAYEASRKPSDEELAEIALSTYRDEPELTWPWLAVAKAVRRALEGEAEGEVIR